VRSTAADPNAQGGRFGNALQAASARGHDVVVQMLLDKGADPNAQGGRFGNALQAASARGHDVVVQMLLNKGADPNAQEDPLARPSRRALEVASELAAMWKPRFRDTARARR
jgi:ankyrin repeat protein